MANDTIRDTSGLPSPDPATSEGESSVQVHYDSLSHRGRSIGRRSRSPSVRPSPSRAPEPSLARQATANSLSSFLSSQSSSQPSQSDRAPPEDLLRDLIAATESNSSAVPGTLHGVKRRHGQEAPDEPLPKRDKLGEELDRMSASRPAGVSVAVPSSAASSLTVSATTECTPSANSTGSNGVGGRPTATLGTRVILPVRAPRQGLPQLGNGADMVGRVLSSTIPPTASRDDESEPSSDGRET